MKNRTSYLIWALIIACGILVLDKYYIECYCPSTRPPPPPTPPPPGVPSAPDRPQRPQPQPQPETPPPSSVPAPSVPTTPRPDGGTAGTKPPTSAPPQSSVSRPSLSIGLQPLFQNMQSLVGAVEPWEVWWTRNRDKYLSFRQPIEWVKIIDEAGSRSLTIYPIYDELLNVLSEGIQDKDQFVAFRAAVSLGKVPDPQNPALSSIKALEILKRTHKTETRDFVRDNILLGLGLTGDNSVIDIIKEVIQNKKDNTALRRSYAALSLGYMPNNNSITKALQEILTAEKEDREVEASACISLGNLKDTSAISLLGKALTASTGGKKEHPQIRGWAALGLGRIGTAEALAELKKCTPNDEKDVDVRSAVVVALGMTGLAEAKDALLPYLQDKTPVIKGLAAVALAQILGSSNIAPSHPRGGDNKAYEIILDALQKNKSNDADGLMTLALGLTRDEKAKPELRKILESKKSRALLRASAALALGLLKDTEATPLLVNLLSDEKLYSDVTLTPYLILSAGMIRDERAVEPLQKIWAKADKNLAMTAYTNLAIALTMLGKKKEVLERLKEHLTSKDIYLRAYALHTLALIGDRESAKAFVEAAKDNNSTVRASAITGIGFLMDKNAINPLNKVTADNIDVQMLIMEHILPIPVW